MQLVSKKLCKIVMVSIVCGFTRKGKKCWVVLIRKPLIFFFFWDGFSETRPTKIGGFACFWVKSLKPGVVSLKPGVLLWWFHWNQGFWRSQNPLVSMNTTTTKSPGFNEYHLSVSSFYTQITREYCQFRRPSFTEYRPKNKKIWARFQWNRSFSHFLPHFTSEYH